MDERHWMKDNGHQEFRINNFSDLNNINNLNGDETRTGAIFTLGPLDFDLNASNA